MLIVKQVYQRAIRLRKGKYSRNNRTVIKRLLRGYILGKGKEDSAAAKMGDTRVAGGPYQPGL